MEQLKDFGLLYTGSLLLSNCRCCQLMPKIAESLFSMLPHWWISYSAAFSALTQLCIRKNIWPVKNWVMRYWHGYLSGARCKWFAYSLADATATPSSLASLKSGMVLSFWYQLTQIVLEKRPLSMSVYSVTVFCTYFRPRTFLMHCCCACMKPLVVTWQRMLAWIFQWKQFSCESFPVFILNCNEHSLAVW